MASLSDIAAIYTFKLFGFTELGGSKAADHHRRGPVDRDHDLDLLPRHRALGAHPAGAARRRDLHPRAVLRRRLRQGLRQPSAGRLDQAVAVVDQPLRDELRRPRRRAAARGVHLLGLGFRGRGQRGVRGPGRGPGQGGGRLDDPARADLRRRLGGVAVIPRRRLPDQRSKPGRRPQRPRHGRARRTPEQAADHRRAHLGLGLDPDDDPADGPHDAVDGALESRHQPALARAQTLPDPDRLDARLRPARRSRSPSSCCCSPRACSKTR